MRAKLAIATFAGLVVLASCTGKGQNTTDPYTVQSGNVELAVEVTEDQAARVKSVQFSVDDKPIGTDNAGPDWKVTFDTKTVADGVHVVTAIGNPGEEDIKLLESSIFVKNGTGAGAAAPAAFKK